MSEPKSPGPTPATVAEGDAPPRKDRAGGRAARSSARLSAVQALYQMEITGAPWRDVGQEFETWRHGSEIDGAQYHEPDRTHFLQVIEGVVARQVEIDQLTDAALVDRWPLGRVDPTLRAIFRCAGFEFLAMPAAPARVIVTEYLDVAKAFFDAGQEARFVNGVLDAMARVARGEAAFDTA